MGANEIIFLGDAVGYIPSMRVVDHLISIDDKVICLLGNHEDMLIRGDISAEKDKVYQFSKTKKMMDLTHLEYIEKWKLSHSMVRPIGKLLFVHGSPNDPLYDYVYPDSDLSKYNTDADFVFMGNSHHPFIRKYQDTTFINVGSCGLPRDDGRYGSVVLFDDKTGVTRVIRFDICEASARTLVEYNNIHVSVTNLFDRKKQELFGELYGE